jgi:biotin carboxyl carrier protein
MSLAIAYNGEEIRDVQERVIVAPTGGVFRTLPAETFTTEGEIIRLGQSVGVITASGDEIDVRSAFEGWMMGMLAVEGERVREGQPIAWLRQL